MSEVPTPWSLLGQAFRDADDPTRLLADLQTYGYPEPTEMEKDRG